MHKLNLPEFEIKIKSISGKNHVFDELRKKFVCLTPEEWVRQHFVHLLLKFYKYPKSLIKLEGGLTYNTLKKRTDIVVYDRQGNTFLIVECKAATVPITQTNFKQVTTYNFSLKARYIVVTNGIKHYCCEINHEQKSFSFLKDLPAF